MGHPSVVVGLENQRVGHPPNGPVFDAMNMTARPRAAHEFGPTSQKRDVGTRRLRIQFEPAWNLGDGEQGSVE